MGRLASVVVRRAALSAARAATVKQLLRDAAWNSRVARTDHQHTGLVEAQP
jgi:hypothetical protein